MHKTRLNNGAWAWTTSSIKYTHEADRNYMAHQAANYSGIFRLLKKEDNTFKMGYDPEMDASPELEPVEHHTSRLLLVSLDR